MASKYTLQVDEALPLTVQFWTKSPNTIDCVVYLRSADAISWRRLLEVNSPEEVVKSELSFELAPLPAKTTLWLQLGAIGRAGTPYLIGIRFLQHGKALPLSGGGKAEQREIVFEGGFVGSSWVADMEVKLR